MSNVANVLTADVKAWRKELRAKLIEARSKVSQEAHRAASLRIEGFLEGLFQTLPYRSLSFYWPFPGEIDLRPLMERLREQRGWTVSLPRVVKQRAPLEFLRWDAGAEMEIGVFDIPAPKERHPLVPDVVIAPLIGFDAENGRLGFGGGFFDITLGSMHPLPKTVGVGLELGRLETIKPAITDIPFDYIVTEAGIHERRAAGH